jgi:hypothetical protein
VADKKLIRFKNPDLLWSHLRSVATGSGSWALRRGAAHELIDPVIEAVIDTTESPTDHLITGATVRLNADSVRDAWDKAIARRDNDPDGAITMARTLLESTLKTVLEDCGVAYKDSDDLPTLYKAVSKQLALAPGAYSEESFKQILGGCNSVVLGLGSLRNKAGDAHGSGRKSYRPAGRPVGPRRQARNGRRAVAAARHSRALVGTAKQARPEPWSARMVVRPRRRARTATRALPLRRERARGALPQRDPSLARIEVAALLR